MTRIWRKEVASALALAMPAVASAGPAGRAAGSIKAGPITAAIAKAGDEITAAQAEEGRSRGRLWTSIALIAGGSVLGVLGATELGDDDEGPDDGEDLNGSDDGEDSDGWGNTAMLGGGIAAAALGGVLLMTGGKKHGPVVAVQRRGIVVRHTIAFPGREHRASPITR
jgi:hypothetical protein